MKRKNKSNWNIGKGVSENYEFMTFAFYALQTCQGSERKMLSFIRKAKLFEDEKLFEKPLGSDMLRMLNREKEPLNIILNAHLFIENFLDVIIQRKFKHSQLLLQNSAFTFSMKVDVLRAKNYLDDKLYNDIKLLNRLRNKYAHDLYYDLDDFEIAALSYCEDFTKHVKPPTKAARVAAKIYMLKVVLYYLLLRLTNRYPFIGGIELPEKIHSLTQPSTRRELEPF
ncbi:MAG: hypothetical protein OEW04_01540 [Nitrospirota bacterium]|nr:hypothetical protein [Nitrospirota bacterium]